MFIVVVGIEVIGKGLAGVADPVTFFIIVVGIQIVDKRFPRAAGEMAVPDTGEIRAGLAELSSRLTVQLGMYVENREAMLASRDPAHAIYALSQRIDRHLSDAAQKKTMMDNSIGAMLEKMASDISVRKASLEAMSPSEVMKRGYGIVKDSKGNIVTRASSVRSGDDIDILMSDGAIAATVREKGE